jgi:GST-like protein
MIDLYTWTTPNGRKVSIFLEEADLPYSVHPIDIGNGAQHTSEFLAIGPNAKIPAIVDNAAAGGPVSVFESGAILIYLAEKAGRFLPTDAAGRAATLEWLMFQMSGVGPTLGQLNYWLNTAEERIPAAISRFMDESVRQFGVLDGALARNEYLAGDYSIADMATYPWIAAAWGPFSAMMPDKVGELTNLGRWVEAVGARPAVAKGMAVPQE